MADSAVVVTAGTGTNIDTRTEATNGNHRQVVVLGDPATNAGVAPVDATAGLKVDLGADNDVTVTGTVDLGATDNAVLDAIAAKDFATQTTLAAINSKLASGTVIGDVNLGATDNAVLDAIEADTTTIAGDTTSIDAKIPPLGQALAAASVPVILPAATITTLTPPAAITGFATSAKQDTIIGHLDGVETLLGTIDADTGSIDAKTPALGQALAAASVPVVLTAAQITTLTPPTPQTDALTDTQLRATAVPVSGTVTANLSATDNAVLDDIALDTEAIKTSLAGTLTVTGGGGGTEYTEDAAAAANPVGNALILVREDARGGSLTTTDGDNVAARGNNKGEQYVKDTDAAALLTTIDADTSNLSTKIDTIAGAVAGTEMQVDVLTMPSVAVTNAGITTIAGAVAGTEMQVDVLTMPTVTVNAHAVTNAGTFAVQATGTVDLGANDNAVLDAIAASVAAINTGQLADGHSVALSATDNAVLDTIDAVLDTIKTDTASIVTATQLIDDTVFADDAAVTLGTSKGNVSAGVAVATDGTDPTAVSAEGDAAALRTDMNRLLIVNQTHPRFWHVSADYASAQTNASVKAAPGASLSLYITDISISNGATAGNITLLDGSGGTVLLEIYPAINGGAVMSLRSPIKLTANTALCITSTTVTTHSLFVSGYIAA